MWRGIVNMFVDVAGFRDHVNGLKFGGWRPSFVVVHNTSEPDLAKWSEWRSRSGWTPEQWGRNLENYYRDQQHWSAGPHCFVAPDGILLFTPLTVPGTHSPAWNNISWGVETVGEFETDTFVGSKSQSNLIQVLASLHECLGLDPADYRLGAHGLHFHKEDPRTTHKSCPGRYMVKADLVAAVAAQMLADNGGSGHAPLPAQEGPVTVTTLPQTYQVHGKMSVFGGPKDTGVSPREGLAIIDVTDLQRPDTVLLPQQPAGTTGLARRLDPDKHYLAMRWDYHRTPISFLRRNVVQVTANGKTLEARPADWGPNANTGRVADISPGLARDLGLNTDDQVTVTVPLPGVSI